MSLNIALYNAVTGLQLNQRALDITSQNVANVNTEGYSRKIIEQQAMVIDGQGAGVKIAAITRRVDEFLLKDMRETLGRMLRFFTQSASPAMGRGVSTEASKVRKEESVS